MAASYQFIGHSREGGNPVRTMWFPALIQGVRIQGVRVVDFLYAFDFRSPPCPAVLRIKMMCKTVCPTSHKHTKIDNLCMAT